MKKILILFLLIVLLIVLVILVGFCGYEIGNRIEVNNSQLQVNNLEVNTSNVTNLIPEYEKVMTQYTNAMENSDFNTINDLKNDKTSGNDLVFSREIWESIRLKITKIELQSKTDTKIIYNLGINVIDNGMSAFEKGETTRYLIIEKINNIWFVTALATGL